MKIVIWICLSSAILLNACATAPHNINLTYHSTSDKATIIPGASSIKLKIIVRDERPKEQREEAKNIVGLYKNELADELAERGFSIADNGLTVEAQLHKCQSSSLLFLVSADVTSRMSTSINIINPEGKTIFSKFYLGESEKSPVIITINYSLNQALKETASEALSQNINEVLNDREFINVLLSIK